MKKNILALLCALAIVSPIFAQVVIGNLSYQGQTRTYNVYLPSSYTQGANLPVVFVLHALTMTGQRIMQVSGFNGIADANDFIAVYPDGIGGSWNVGFGIPGASTADDVGFIDALVDELGNLYGIDQNRLYACGLSNGGFLSYKLACESSKCFAAIAPVASVMTDSDFASCNPSNSVPIMHIHGTADAIVSYSGIPGVLKSVDEVLAYWLFSNNNCTGNPTITPVPDTNPLDFSTVDRLAWNPCDNGAEVELLRVNGGGHQWPGTTTLLGGLGTINQDINASQEIWNFFTRFTCNQSAVNPIPAAPTVTASPATVCLGTTSTLTATAPGGSYEWFTQAIAGTAIASGASYTTPVLLATTTYWIQTTIGNNTSARTPVTVTVDPNPQPAAPLATALPASICAGAVSVLTSTLPISGNIDWYDAATGGNLLGSGGVFITPVLSTTTTYWAEPVRGNCIGPRTAVTVTVSPLPAAPAATASPSTVCQGATTTLTASGSAGVYQWFDSPTGGILLWVGASYTTLPVATTTYYVQSTDGNLCTGARTAVTVTVNPAPASPTVAAPATICAGMTSTLTATAPGGTYEWFDLPVGGTSLGTGASFTTPSLSLTTVYWVQSTDANGCVSPRTPVTVNVTPVPPAPTVRARPATICSGNSTVLVSRAITVTDWYDAPAGGNLLGSGRIFTTPALAATTTFYAETSIGSCNSTRTAVTVTVNPLPAAPSANASPSAMCYGGTTVITATAPGGTYLWYTVPTGGFPIWAGASFNTPPLFSQTTYYVEVADANSCISSRTSVTITVKSFVSPPSVTAPTPVCSGSSASISANASAGTVTWYDTPTGGMALGTGISFTTSALNSSTIYWVAAESQNCSSIRVPVAVAVIPAPIAPLTAAWPTTVCSGGIALLLAASPGATINWYDTPAGGSLLSSGPVLQTASLSATTTFYAEPSIQGCTGPRSPITITLGNCKKSNTEDDGNIRNDLSIFKVYPNPSNGLLNIDYSDNDKSFLNINIYDTSGKLVFLEEFSQTNGPLKYRKTLNLTQLTKGIYLLQVLTDGGAQIKKFVID